MLAHMYTLAHTCNPAGTDLKRANVFGSDPYIIAKTMQQEVRTAVKYYSLNPEWKETHDFMVYDKDSQNVAIEVQYAIEVFVHCCGNLYVLCLWLSVRLRETSTHTHITFVCICL